MTPHDDRGDDGRPMLTSGLGRLAGSTLALAAVLVVAVTVVFVVEDRVSVLVLLVLLAAVTLPVLGAALLSAGPALALLTGRRPPPRTPVLAALLAVGHVGVTLVALRPGVDDALSTTDLAGAGVGAVGLIAALVALALTLPGRPAAARVLLAVSGGVLVLALAALQAVLQTAG